jgi:hypothetical protein
MGCRVIRNGELKMRKILLHCGLHKTGSTWLQADVFPNWKEIKYAGRFFEDELLDNLSADKPIVISNESLAGYPYPITSGFDPGIIEENIKKYNATHVLLVEREFYSWCLSVYMQTLNEGMYWSLDEFLKKNKKIIEWKYCCDAISEKCKEMNITFISLRAEDIRSNPQGSIDKLANALGVRSMQDVPKGERNSSRYGIVFIYAFRVLNYFFRGRIRHKLGIRPMLQRSWVGGFFDGISIRRINPDTIRNNMMGD